MNDEMAFYAENLDDVTFGSHKISLNEACKASVTDTTRKCFQLRSLLSLRGTLILMAR